MSQYINQLFTCVLREFQQNNLFRFNTLTFRHFLLLLEIDYQKFLALGVVLTIRSDHLYPRSSRHKNGHGAAQRLV